MIDVFDLICVVCIESRRVRVELYKNLATAVRDRTQVLEREGYARVQKCCWR